MSERLKPCPFCGGTAKVQRSYGFYKVYCTECKATNLKLVVGGTCLDSYKTRQEAIEAWNRRTDNCKNCEALKFAQKWC